MFDLKDGIQISKTTVIDSNRNLTNIGSVTASSNSNIGGLFLGADGTYGSYDCIGFSGNTNGHNRIFGYSTTGGGMYITSATSQHIHFRTNGSSADTFRITSDGSFQIGSTTVIDSNRNATFAGLTIAGNGSEINFTGNNNRIKFSGYRAMEGTNDGSGLFLGEQYVTVNCMSHMNLTSGHSYRINGTTIIDSSRNGTLAKLDVGGSGFEAPQGVAQFRGDVTLNRGSFVRWANGAGGTGEYIYSKSASPYDVTLHSGAYDSLRCPNNGIVYIAYQGSTRITTTSAGVSVTGALTASGNITAYSDKRKKKDIIELESGLDYINKIDAVRFTWKDSDKKDIGFIAQDVEKYLPEFITDEDIYDYSEEAEVIETVKTMDYSRMTAVLWKAVKEQQDMINELKQEIEVLKNGNYTN